MAHPVTLSKTKLLAYAQCPRKLWLAQYSPELEDESTIDYAALETGRVVGAKAREIYGRGTGQRIAGERGLRAAIAATSELLAAGGREPIFEATFDYEGLTVQIDVLDRSGPAPRIVEVKSSSSVKEHHLLDCAIQAWTLEQLGIAVGGVALAHIDGEFVYGGDGNYAGLLAEQDLTEAARDMFARVADLVADARATLEALDEPQIPIGEHCNTPYSCPFFAHCAPPQGPYPVTALGGHRKDLYALMLEGHRDLRDVSEDRLASDRQQRIWRQTRLGQTYVGAELRDFARSLPYPRYYLDFETIAFAIPIWAGTRPYQALPFQWSVHIEDAGADESSAGLGHASFLDLSGEPPMRACAETLVEALGATGPIVVYSSYERRMIGELIDRYPDLTAPLAAIRERLVDLLPLVKAHYYDPEMRGSWSIKSVLPTIAPGRAYATLGEVRDGEAAQAAYLEAIKPITSPRRREQLRHDLLAYCSYDTLAMVELVAFFGRVAPALAGAGT